MRLPLWLLVALFGSSSWMGTNSVWMQLPLLTARLPEHWSLPSALAAVVQMACIGPLVFGVAHKWVRGRAARLILLALAAAVICQTVLAFTWDTTADVFGASRSVSLYVLLFGLALVNATSNVLFLPYMAQFAPHLLTAYFVGMGLSSLVPSMLALAQGSSAYDCVPDANSTALFPVYRPARFGARVFFLCVAGWTAAAWVAFYLLNKSQEESESSSVGGKEGEEKTDPHEGTPLTSKSTEEGKRADDDHQHGEGAHTLSRGASIFVLLATALVNAQMNGVIPSIHSYAALPYSQTVYHLGLTLSNLVSPVASFLPFFIQLRSLTVLAVLTAVSSLATGCLLWLALLSPNLAFQSWLGGGIFSVSASMLAAGVHSYLRAVFAGLMREGAGSERRLFWCGVFIQIGSFVGSAVMFPLVNFTSIFQSAPPC